MELGRLPTIRGSERQQTWADGIRRGRLPELLKLLGHGAAHESVELPGMPFDLNPSLAMRLRDWFLDQDSADWWIDVGRQPARRLIASAMRDLASGIDREFLDFVEDGEAMERYAAGRGPDG